MSMSESELDALLKEIEEPGKDNPDPNANTSNSAIKKVREWGDKGWSAAKEAEKELKELRTYREQTAKAQRESTVASTFKELELSDKIMDLYTGEPEPEAIKQWAVDHDFVKAEAGDTTEEKSKGFVPGGTGTGTDPGVTKVSAEDFEKLSREDPARANELFRAGRVELEKMPGNENRE